MSHSVQNVQIEVARVQEIAAYVNGSTREVLMRIDNTLADIKDELQTRNQVERKRLLFDVAKFKFLHPNFNFDPAQWDFCEVRLLNIIFQKLLSNQHVLIFKI